jgi:hypothetical protein
MPAEFVPFVPSGCVTARKPPPHRRTIGSLTLLLETLWRMRALGSRSRSRAFFFRAARTIEVRNDADEK